MSALTHLAIETPEISTGLWEQFACGPVDNDPVYNAANGYLCLLSTKKIGTSFSNLSISVVTDLSDRILFCYAQKPPAALPFVVKDGYKP
jgi:hypothetical protein